MILTLEEKNEIRKKLEDKGVNWEEAAEEIKVPVEIMNLYFSQWGAVPDRIINGLNKMLE